MNIFTVTILEIRKQYVDVRAENEEDALVRVMEGEGTYAANTDLLRTLDVSEWDVIDTGEEQ